MSAPGADRLLALTRGDPSGIGLEVALKAWGLGHGDPGTDPFLLVDDIAHARRAAARLGLDVPLVATTAAEAPAIFPHALPVLPLEIETRGIPGKPDAGRRARHDRFDDPLRRARSPNAAPRPWSPCPCRRKYCTASATRIPVRPSSWGSWRPASSAPRRQKR